MRNGVTGVIQHNRMNATLRRRTSLSGWHGGVGEMKWRLATTNQRNNGIRHASVTLMNNTELTTYGAANKVRIMLSIVRENEEQC